MAEREQKLKQLQEELLSLKQQVPGLQLRRSTASQSPEAPFPITCTSEVVAPAEAERYDVASFTLLARIHSSILTAPPQSSVQDDQRQAVAAAVAVEVTSAELPRALREAIAERLHRQWRASQPALGQLDLALLWSAAQRQFVGLITLLPHLLEPYQTEDASGSTVRRWAVINEEASVTIDAAVHPTRTAPAPPKPAAGTAAPEVIPGPAAAGARAASQRQPLQRPAAAGVGSAALPRALAQELELLQKRHGLRLVPQQQGAVAAAAQLAQLNLSASAPAAAAGGSARGSSSGPTAAAEAPSCDTSSRLDFELELRPTDPAWDPAQPLRLQGWLAAGYPQAGSLAVEVSEQQQQALPLLQRQVLDKLLAAEVAAACGRPAALRSVVRYVENHAGQLWQQAEDIAAEVSRRRQQQADQQQARSVAAGGHASEIGSDTASTGSYDDGSLDSDSDGDGSAERSGREGSSAEGEGPDADEALRSGGGGHSDRVLPLALQLEGLELDGADALELLRLNLQVACSRCKASGDLSFATAAVALPSDGGGGKAEGKGRSSTLSVAAECGNCHADWAVEVAPKLLHDRSNVLAHVRAQGCSPADLLPSMLAGQCSQCCASAAFRSVAVGRWNERACSACHTPMRFQFSSALFVPHKRQLRQGDAEGGQAAGGRRRDAGTTAAPAAAAAAYNALLQLGQPLPDRGTCRHYRHSYRWLRFPCCGKRFPCDLCHEENTDGHEMKWANRMVCGFCSLEQAVAPQCKACGKKVATSAAAPSGRRTRFWEGGKGQRDPNKLDRNDPRRYRNRHKTRSQKSKRVGEEAKARRERQQG